MTDKERITEILKAYTKKHNISASVVILEEYAEELVRQGVMLEQRNSVEKHLETANAEIERLLQELDKGIFRPNDSCPFGVKERGKSK